MDAFGEMNLLRSHQGRVPERVGVTLLTGNYVYETRNGTGLPKDSLGRIRVTGDSIRPQWHFYDWSEAYFCLAHPKPSNPICEKCSTRPPVKMNRLTGHTIMIS